MHSLGKEQECREVFKLHTSPCVLSLQFSPRPLIRFRWGCVTRRDFSWGHPDTQWQLPEAAAAWKNSKTRKFYAMGERGLPSISFSHLTCNATVWRAGLDSDPMGSQEFQDYGVGGGIPGNCRPTRAMERLKEKSLCACRMPGR